jgi:hypothetical protein
MSNPCQSDFLGIIDRACGIVRICNTDFKNKINQKEVVEYLSLVTGPKEAVAEPGNGYQRSPSAPAQNIPGELWIGGVLYYNNERVCRMLDATERTMQRYRITGILPFKNVNNKYFYCA